MQVLRIFLAELRYWLMVAQIFFFFFVSLRPSPPLSFPAGMLQPLQSTMGLCSGDPRNPSRNLLEGFQKAFLNRIERYNSLLSSIWHQMP